MQLEERLHKELAQRVEANSFRSLKAENLLIDFSSNDYLGLAQSTDLQKLIHYKSSTLNNGASGSRLLSGNSKLCTNVEKRLSEIFNTESALTFNSGYSANLAILSTIPKRGDTIIYDELAHACIKDGARLSLATRYSFKHNNLDDLKKKLDQAAGQAFIAVESIYSMDGDQCPLQEVIQIAEEYQAEVIVDEAHATGVIGPNGSGLSGLINASVLARVYTFGKAMGIHGAAIGGSQTLINYLINFARPFIYTTALPPHSIVSIDESFKFLNNNIRLQKQLSEKVSLFNALFKEKLSERFKKVESNHAIQAIIIPGNTEAKRISETLENAGFDVRPILSPTVKKGEERLRICLHVYNTNEEITALIDTLAAVN